MAELGPTDALPGNLSEQQLFVLGILASKHDPDQELMTGVSYSTLSWAAAEEFDDDESHIEERTYGYRWKVLTDDHTASFSRTVKRLEQRGYLDRQGGRWENSKTKRIVPTDRGLRAGWEAIRRHRDGRYSLHFDTFEIEVDRADE